MDLQPLHQHQLGMSGHLVGGDLSDGNIGGTSKQTGGYYSYSAGTRTVSRISTE